MFVAENDDGEIVGFASGSLESDVDGFEGSLNTLYVLDDYQGEGIGSMLVIAVAERFKELNVNGMVIWTYTENPSRGFYEHLGGKTVCQKNIERNGSEISLTAYGWNDIDSILYK
jgi:GNAT superfamily N-acetyltransferase